MAASDYVNGYQHIGIPSNDIDKTVAFFEALGFEKRYETENNGRVVFLGCKNIMIETYEKFGEATEKRGAIDHIALDVTDLEKTLEEVKKTGYPIVEGPAFLPFWENGVRYFTIEGPDKEAVEFSQML